VCVTAPLVRFTAHHNGVFPGAEKVLDEDLSRIGHIMCTQ